MNQKGFTGMQSDIYGLFTSDVEIFGHLRHGCLLFSRIKSISIVSVSRLQLSWHLNTIAEYMETNEKN